MDEINVTVFQCPVCGGVLDFPDGAEETSCKSCGNKVHKFKTKTEVNLKIEYAIVSDGSKFQDNLDFVPEDLFRPRETDLREVEHSCTGADVVKLNGLIKQLVWNYAQPQRLTGAEREACVRLARSIREIDEDNVYAEFLGKVAFPEHVDPAQAEDVLTRADALEIAPYILPVLREKPYQGLEVSAHFVNYIVHCEIADEEKYNNIMAVLTSKYLVVASLAEVQPILVDILGLTLPREKRFKLLTMLYSSIATGSGFSALEEIAGFIQYIMLSDLGEEQRFILLRNLIKFDLARLTSFDETVRLLGILNGLTLPEEDKANLIASALAKCTPKNLSFEGYFDLSGYIRQPVQRFKYLFLLFLSQYNKLFFHLETAVLFYYQQRLTGDEMLLLLDMCRVFAEDNVKADRLAAMKTEVERYKKDFKLTSGYANVLLADPEIKGYFNFLVRYEDTKPAQIVAGLTPGTGYSEAVERALYSLSSLRLYYHKIYEIGIVAPYRTLDALDGTVARLSDIKAKYVQAGNKPYQVTPSRREKREERGKQPRGKLAADFLALLVAALFTAACVLSLVASEMEVVGTVLLGIVLFAAFYLVSDLLLRFIFNVRRNRQ